MYKATWKVDENDEGTVRLCSHVGRKHRIIKHFYVFRLLIALRNRLGHRATISHISVTSLVRNLMFCCMLQFYTFNLFSAICRHSVFRWLFFLNEMLM
jgi:hypothetical protein